MKTLRKLHSYIGIYACWLLFIITFFGTISYFRNEIDFYMQPKLHESKTILNNDINGLSSAINYAQEKYKDYDFISIKTPSYYNNLYEINYYNSNSTKGERKSNISYFDGENILNKTSTLGAKFLTSIHYKLLPINGSFKDFLEAIVSIFAAGIIFLYISGILIWNKKNFNKINVKNDLARLFDFHIVAGLFVGSFLFILALSGIGINYIKDIEKLFTTTTTKQAKTPSNTNANSDKSFIFDTNLISKAINNLENTKNITIILNKNTKEFAITLNDDKNVMPSINTKSNRSYIFDSEANVKQTPKESKLSAFSSIYEIFFNIHRVMFADFQLYFILFLCGIFTCLFIYKALLLASKKHKDNLLYKAIAYAAFYPSLNATAIYFIANKLTQNMQVEQFAFLISFILSIILSYIFVNKTKNLMIISLIILLALLISDICISGFVFITMMFDFVILLIILGLIINLRRANVNNIN